MFKLCQVCKTAFSIIAKYSLFHITYMLVICIFNCQTLFTDLTGNRFKAKFNPTLIHFYLKHWNPCWNSVNSIIFEMKRIPPVIWLDSPVTHRVQVQCVHGSCPGRAQKMAGVQLFRKICVQASWRRKGCQHLIIELWASQNSIVILLW